MQGESRCQFGFPLVDQGARRHSLQPIGPFDSRIHGDRFLAAVKRTDGMLFPVKPSHYI